MSEIFPFPMNYYYQGELLVDLGHEAIVRFVRYNTAPAMHDNPVSIRVQSLLGGTRREEYDAACGNIVRLKAFNHARLNSEDSDQKWEILA